MKNSRRNKKLFKNIAIIILISIILYVFKNVYFYKKPIIEGFGKDFTEYKSDALALKLDIATDPGIVEKFNSYVSIYGDVVDHDVSELNEEESSSSSGPGDLNSVETVLKNKLGSANYNKLKSIFMNDPKSSYYRYLKANTPDVDRIQKELISGILKKIEDLYEQIPQTDVALE